MLAPDREKISLKQALFLFLTAVYTPAVRLAANYTAIEANHAGWLCPLASFPVLVILLWLIKSIYMKHKTASFSDLLNIILGKLAGKIVLMIYIVYITLLLALYVRYYAERLVTSTYPGIKIQLFMVVMLVMVAYILRKGIVIIARMNEIIIIFLTFVFFLLFIFLMPEIEINKLTPISYMDILPVMKGSLGITALWIYIFFIFIFSDRIMEKDKVMDKGLGISVFLLLVTLFLIISSIGSLGASIISRTPLSFYAAVRQVKAFGIFERLESILVTSWVISDFIIISVFTFIILEMVKGLFNLSHIKPLINIFILFIYVLSLYISKNIFELQTYSSAFAVPANIFFGFIFPLILLLIGKIRRKV